MKPCGTTKTINPVRGKTLHASAENRWKSDGRQKMTMEEDESTVAIEWSGPYSWPGYESENNLPSTPRHTGIYLMTAQYRNGYVLYAAGLSRRPIPTRFREHTRKYMSGDYTVLDIAALQHGIRKEIWHGWGWTEEKRRQFENRKEAILEAARKQLIGFRIFVAQVPNRPRLLERFEASIMDHLYRQPTPLCDVPDKGMMLAPRWESEKPVTVRNRCAVKLHGLPATQRI